MERYNSHFISVRLLFLSHHSAEAFTKNGWRERDCRNVPGVSMYFLTLSKFRQVVGNVAFFRQDKGLAVKVGEGIKGGKVKLTTTGDLLVGSTARTGVGFLLMPFTLMKTISEVRQSLLPSFAQTSRKFKAD